VSLYILKRLALLVPVLAGASFLVFAMMELVPGDAAVAMLGPYATPENVERLRESMNLDAPMPARYFSWLKNLARLDLGRAHSIGRPVREEVLERFGATMVLSGAAFAVAVGEAVTEQSVTAERLTALGQRLSDGIRARFPSAVLNGDPVERLPGLVHVTFPGCEGDALLMLLDAAGIECSTGSACTSGIPEPSHVLLAMGVESDIARGSLRFSMSAATTPADIDALLDVLPGVVDRAARAAAPRLQRRA